LLPHCMSFGLNGEPKEAEWQRNRGRFASPFGLNGKPVRTERQ